MTTTKAPAPQPDRPAPKQDAPQVEGSTFETAARAASAQQLTPRAILQLQKTIGNRATMQLIQRRLGTLPGSGTSGGSGGGLPPSLKAGIESLSGVDMNDVQVHHNSGDAAKVNALAYAQGNQIHLGPGQERHLPHEAWHVVQQKLGRVSATGSVPDGRALNDDPTLETEADQMGARAAQYSPPAAERALQRISVEGEAPIQGVFTQEGQWQKDESGFKNAHYVNQDDKKVYVLVGYGPGDGVVPYFIVSPVDDSNVKLAIRPIPGSPNQWEAISESQRQELDVHAKARGLDVVAPTPKVHPTDFTTAMPNINIKPGAFEQGTAQPFLPESSDEEILQVARISSLVTGFTGQVVVVPTEAGELSQYKSLDFQEQRFTPGQVWVQNILISDERLNTQFGADQERHTVSYTLSRNATIRLANRTAQDLILYLSQALQQLAPLVYNIEYESTDLQSKEKITKHDNAGPMLIQAFSGSDILGALLKGKLPIDRWQFALSALIRAYYQIYQLSSGATFGHGKSTYKGESFARNKLDEDNDQAKSAKTKRRPVKEMAADAQKMIDVRMDLNVLGVEAFAFAVNHWMDLLKVMYPDLMALTGKEIVQPFLDTAVSATYAKAIMEEQQEAKVASPKAIKTRRDVLEYYDYKPDDVTATKPVNEKLTVGGLLLPNIPLGQFNTDFMVSMSVMPIAQGVQQPYSIGFGTNAPNSIQLEAYTPGQVGVKSVMLGDKERPNTKYISHQRSHTVAWTLVRHQMMGYSGRPLSVFLSTMAKNFAALATDIHHQDGLTVAAQALAVVNHYNGTPDTIDKKGTPAKALPIHDWQTLVSAVARWYLIAYSSAESASYIAPKQHDQALGNSEAWAMKVLRRNEYSIASGEKLPDDTPTIYKAALKLMDAYLNAELDQQGALNAYHHWNDAMQDAFPALMKQGGDPIRGEMKKRKIADTVTFGDIVK